MLLKKHTRGWVWWLDWKGISNCIWPVYTSPLCQSTQRSLESPEEDRERERDRMHWSTHCWYLTRWKVVPTCTIDICLLHISTLYTIRCYSLHQQLLLFAQPVIIQAKCRYNSVRWWLKELFFSRMYRHVDKNLPIIREQLYNLG